MNYMLKKIEKKVFIKNKDLFYFLIFKNKIILFSNILSFSFFKNKKIVKISLYFLKKYLIESGFI